MAQIVTNKNIFATFKSKILFIINWFYLNEWIWEFFSFEKIINKSIHWFKNDYQLMIFWFYWRFFVYIILHYIFRLPDDDTTKNVGYATYTVSGSLKKFVQLNYGSLKTKIGQRHSIFNFNQLFIKNISKQVHKYSVILGNAPTHHH